MGEGYVDCKMVSYGVLFSLICGGLIWLSSYFEIVGGKAISEISVYALIVFLFGRERGVLSWSIRSIALIVAYFVVMILMWVAINFPLYCGKSMTLFSRFDLVLGGLTACVAAPLFEEKIFRYFILDGLAPRFGGWGGSVIVSVIFASAHWGNFLWAFIASLILCALKVKFDMGTVMRAVVHGLVNGSIIFISINCYLF